MLSMNIPITTNFQELHSFLFFLLHHSGFSKIPIIIGYPFFGTEALLVIYYFLQQFFDSLCNFQLEEIKTDRLQKLAIDIIINSIF